MTARHITFGLALVLGIAGAAPAFADEPQTTEAGLTYTIVEAGAGEPPKLGDRVTIDYVGTLPDGSQFASTYDRGQPFSARYDPRWMIAGVYEGLQFVKPGGKIRLEIPWSLGFGERGKPSSTKGQPPIVPPETDIVYEIELRAVEPRPVFQSPEADAWIDVAPGLRYAVLEPGEGEAPTGGQRVRLEYAIWNVRKKLVQSTFGERKHVDGMLSKLRLAEPRRRPGERGEPKGEKMFPEIVGRMKPGEVIWVEANATWTWGADPAHDEVPPNTTTWWELELVEVAEVPEFEKPDAEKQITTPSGLKYEILREGLGRLAKKGSENEVHYVGWKTNGEMFDTSFKTGGTFRTDLTKLIKGWIEGIAIMREGDVYRFEIPPDLAYGSNGPPSIGPNATLIFWVEVVKVW